MIEHGSASVQLRVGSGNGCFQRCVTIEKVTVTDTSGSHILLVT